MSVLLKSLDMTNYTGQIYKIPPAIMVSTSSDSIVTITDGADNSAISLLSYMVVEQEGSGDPSLSNIRPFIGYTSLTATSSGRNLCRWKSPLDLPAENNGIIYSNGGDGTIIATGTASSTSGWYVISAAEGALSALKAGKTYYFSSGHSDVQLQVYVDAVSASYGTSFTYTVPDSFNTISVRLRVPSGTALTNAVVKPLIVLSGDSTTWEPYNGYRVSYDWTNDVGTIYRGYIDAASGMLTVTDEYVVFDGTENWETYGTAGTTRYFAYTADTTRGAYSSYRACTHYPNSTISTSTTTVGYYATTYNNNATLRFRPDLSSIPDVATWKGFLSNQYSNGTPVCCVWNPTVNNQYQLPSKTIETLFGQNSFWCNRGSVQATYAADTKTYIDRKIADVMAAISAL